MLQEVSCGEHPLERLSCIYIINCRRQAEIRRADREFENLSEIRRAKKEAVQEIAQQNKESAALILCMLEEVQRAKDALLVAEGIMQEVRVCVRARARVCVCVCVSACVWAHAWRGSECQGCADCC